MLSCDVCGVVIDREKVDTFSKMSFDQTKEDPYGRQEDWCSECYTEYYGRAKDISKQYRLREAKDLGQMVKNLRLARGIVSS